MAWRVEILRSADLVVFASDFEAFPAGVLFSLLVKLRPGSFEMHRPPMMHPGSPDGPLFGVGFADGRKAMLGVRVPPPPDGEPDGPLLWPRGGGGGGDEWRMGLWLWPLPPPGPLGLVAAWPAKAVAERAVIVDGAEIVGAASRAEKLWDVPDDEPRPGGWFARSSSATFTSGTARKAEPPAGAREDTESG